MFSIILAFKLNGIKFGAKYKVKSWRQKNNGFSGMLMGKGVAPPLEMGGCS